MSAKVVPTELLLGVNIDHIATIRQARQGRYPDPIQAAILAEEAGADGITLHLREDRRHIQDRDVRLLKEILQTRMNLEMAVTDDMLAIASRVKPQHCCLVPERREELTTEGGLDVLSHLGRVRDACGTLAASDIEVSLFIDPDKTQIEAAVAANAPVVEIHTGHYAEAKTPSEEQREYQRIAEAVRYGQELGLIVNAGHGLDYHNVKPIAALSGLNELNIGHSIVARALFIGFKSAVQEMRSLMLEATRSASQAR